MPAPNQRVIYIKRESADVRKDYFKIGHEQLNKASMDLNGNTFKLYIYLANNKDSYRLELSSKDFIQWSGTSDSTYDRAFKELKEKGYLIQVPKKKNFYVFIEESATYEDRHKEDIFVLKGEEDIQEILNTIGLK